MQLAQERQHVPARGERRGTRDLGRPVEPNPLGTGRALEEMKKLRNVLSSMY